MARTRAARGAGGFVRQVRLDLTTGAGRYPFQVGEHLYREAPPQSMINQVHEVRVQGRLSADELHHANAQAGCLI
jgi:hypothetical protein